MFNRIAAVALLLIFSVSVSAQTAPLKERYRKLEYMIPMRDGVKLYTAVYLPRNQKSPSPILLERTPYGAGPYGEENYRGGLRGSPKMQEAGYAFAFQDVRGMGRSEGVFVNDRPQLLLTLKPHDIDESTDTWDTVEYLVKHVPGCNGRVGLWGISYPGFYAGVGAVNSHPALRAASPQAPVSDWFIGDDFHHNGALFLMDAARFARFGQSRNRTFPAQPNPSPGENAYNFWLEAGTLSEITEKYYQHTDGMWRSLMQHPDYDEYWQSRSLPAVMKGVKCAVMTVGGWFDAEDCWGAINTYKGTERLNPRALNTIVMGPWWHGMWSTSNGQQFHDHDWGTNTSRYFQDELEFRFFDAHLRGSGKPNLPEAVMFDTGAKAWREFSAWPPRQARTDSLYFTLTKGLSGSRPAGSGTLAYTSDPANPVPYQGGTIRTRTTTYMVDDQRFAEQRKDVLTFKTDPLTESRTMAGELEAELFIRTDATDVDLVVKIIDEFPQDAPGRMSGYQMLVRGEVMRAKYRNSYSNPAPLTPNSVEKVRFSLPDILHTFAKGHRIVVQIQSSWFPLVDRNPQTFTNIYTASRSEFRKAAIELKTGGETASRLIFQSIPSLKR
jgi:putative CocE/NonD family hydrolase